MISVNNAPSLPNMSGTCEHGILHGERDFTGMIKLRILSWGDYPELSGLAQCNHSGPHKRDAGGSESEEAM